MKKKILYSISGLLIVSLIGGALYIQTLMPIITGYAAKNLASAVFISGRDPASVEALDLNFSIIKYTSNEVDTVNKRVISHFLWGKSTAIYREGFGCTLICDTDEESLRKIKFPSVKRPAFNQDTVLWPLGDKIPKTIDTGIVSEKLNEIATNLIEHDAYNGHAFAFIVLHNGMPAVEKYKPEFNRHTRFLSWSMAKSFTNAFTGVMVKSGILDINKPAEIQAWRDDDRKDITINDLLQMKSGLKWNEDYGSASDVNLMLHREADFSAFVADHPLEFPVGSHWYYSSGSTNIVSRLIRKAINNDDAYYRMVYDSLFYRIGIHDAVFEVDAYGTFVGSSYIYATARDYARFALLYLQDGVFDGKRILPEGWMKYSTTPVSGSNGAYGASFWLNGNGEFPDAPSDMYYCKGHNGQRIFILPSQKLAVVILGYSPKPDQVMEFNRLLGDVLKSLK